MTHLDFNPTVWHKWFAWYPVPTSDRQWCWMRFVERREIDNGLKGSENHASFWIYR